MKDSIGQPKNRLDGRLKVTGQAQYAGDFQEKNLAYAVIFQSSIASGKIKNIHEDQARRVPGVIEIITYENSEKIKKPKAEPGSGMGESFLPLQDNKVFYNGQHIGMVIAETLHAAEQAAKLIKVSYYNNHSNTNLDNMADDSKEMKTMEGMGKINSERGHVKKALQESEVRLTQTYTTPIENHNPMEPSATLAVWKDGEMKVYDSTQGVSSASRQLGQAFKIDPEKTEVITKFIGGGFGCKGSMWGHELMAVMASKKIKRPVKLVLTREQMFTSVGHRARTIQTMSLGCTPSGELKAMEHIVINNTAVNKDYSERSAVPTPMLYKCDNLKAEHRVSLRNYQVPTFMRAPGESSGSFAIECAMDEMAIQLKMDPIELRIKNHADKDQKEDVPFTSKSLKECYIRAADKFGWKKRSAPGQKIEGDYFVGYGMATATYPAQTFPAKAKVELFADGRAKVVSATQDIGTGTYTVMTQIAADYLAIPYENVVFDLGNSHYPKASVSGGSTTASSVGSAIKRACEDVKGQLAKMATEDPQSPLHGAKLDDLVFADSAVSSKSAPGKKDSYVDLLKRKNLKQVAAEGSMEQKKESDKKKSSHSFGAQFVEVRVHRLTGEVKVSRWVGAFAAGKILNTKTARSQFMGGIIFGIGMGLMEQTVPDNHTGRLATKDLADYHVPVNADVPDLDIIMVDEVDTEVNPLGTKGIGEIGIVGAAAAIANAVYNATGVRVRDLPITPDKVLKGLAAKEKTQA